MKFEAQRGNRVHRYFVGVTNFSGMWWMPSSRKWIQGLPQKLSEDVWSSARCRTIRAFRRHLRKHPEIRGKAVLVSRFYGCDVRA